MPITTGTVNPTSTIAVNNPVSRTDSANSNVNAMAPQRYMLVEQNNLIAMPGVGAAWRLSDTLSVGLVLQNASANVSLRRAIAAKSVNGTEG